MSSQPAKDFFERLKGRIFRRPDRNFDQRFWQAFEQEFEAEKSARWSIGLGRRWALAVSTLAIIGVVIFQPRLRSILQEPSWMRQNQEMAQVHFQEILDQQDLLDDMDLFLEFDDLAIADEDWELLLEEKTSSHIPERLEDPS